MNYFFEHLLREFGLPLQNPVLIFSLMLFIILLSPIVLRKVKIPAIIGLILSGVLIGPMGFGLIGKNTMDPEGSVKLFATIGLLYIMFMAGLELDFTQFKKYWTKSLSFGILTFIIPLALGFPLCYWGLKLSPTASLLTASMFATHTLVAYPIISKFGLSKHPAVAIAVGGTILTDTAVLIILAIISSSTKGDLDLSFWLRLGTSLTIFSLIMFLVIPKIARWFFSKLDSEKSSQYIFVLSIIFFSAFLAEVAGVEHIIGAFVAGLVLNKLIPHNSILMNRIDFIGNSLFIPFFLISVGMVVDYRALLQGNWPLIIAGVLTAFAIFSKWLAAFTTAFIFRLKNTERNIIFGLSTSHAAATLAIIMVGYNTILNQKEIDAAKLVNVVLEPNRLLDANVLNGTILLILITCMVASFITETAGKKLLAELAEDSEDGQNETRLRNQHVLVSMNELKGNETLLDFAAVISDSRVINPISVVSVHPNNEDAERTIRKSRKSLEEIMKHFAGHEMKINTIATIDMNLSSGISRVSKELVADLVLLNDSRKLTVIKRLIGDDRQHLLDVCEKSIFFCQLDKPSINYRKIVLVTPLLAELDPAFSLWAERVLRAAKELKIDVKLFGTNNTFDRLIKVSEANNLECTVDHKEIDALDDFFLKATKNIDDLIVVCAARIGSVSYTSDFDGFLLRIEKAYPNNDSVIIYPGQVKDKLFSNYNDVSGEAIGLGVETIQKIGKEVGSIFKKNKDLGE